METRDPLHTHLWENSDIPRRITLSGKILFHHRCVRCARDFVQRIDHPGFWQAAYVGVQRIDLLADSVTQQWVKEECPGRLLTEDCFSRATRQASAPKATNFG